MTEGSGEGLWWVGVVVVVGGRVVLVSNYLWLLRGSIGGTL